ncbi:ubiquitin specific protease 66, putative [Perkinsus marinus ATCC 50983]|uniref:Ubiquitin specific protease 66, putative n=1 Tax=Perkinsus marinus (strain ATCC 50983 / TXsc) TaxID=423536 RepID=C5L3R0_PERM5|nr:ubiquitin specific protease 66, putative [Perkinsus marinus ATCC 50983]EER08639.1 ubiquitin specific protease 66, putative [Perkinsus marinus ATCC 50983]|eukprot:XP_002776823.1 ubiquitin specific protease 66, putative [Perkinsus marinus ATCC 50983]
MGVYTLLGVEKPTETDKNFPKFSQNSRIVTNTCASDGSVSVEAASVSPSLRFVPEGGLVGIRNLGNTCYMNAVLQCLLHTTELYDNFVASDGCGGEICSAFRSLIQNAYGDGGGNGLALEPRAFKKLMGKRNKHWAGSKQQDAQEFLSDILDAMNTEMGGGNVDKVPEGKASRGSLLRLLKRDKAESSPSSASTDSVQSVVSNTFRGVYLSTVHCNSCGYESQTKDLFYVLSLPLSGSEGGSLSLDDCLKQFRKEELLNGDEQWTCDECKQRVDARKRMDLEELPTVLV